MIAEDISRHGHKRYGCCPHSEVDSFIGPYNELIRTHSVCRLYFDLDGGPENLPGDGIVQGIIAQVCTRVYNTYNNRVDPATVIVLCSSNTVKFSKHLIFPTVLFQNNWYHMRNFAATINHPLLDPSVYSRNRCFRMAGCHKYGEVSRVFQPGLPSSALIQTIGEGLESRPGTPPNMRLLSWIWRECRGF